jgi:hypothetical protein
MRTIQSAIESPTAFLWRQISHSLAENFIGLIDSFDVAQNKSLILAATQHLHIKGVSIV